MLDAHAYIVRYLYLHTVRVKHLCRNLQLNVPVKLYNLYWYRFLDSRVIKYFNDDDDYDDDDDDDDKILVLIFRQLYKIFFRKYNKNNNTNCY